MIFVQQSYRDLLRGCSKAQIELCCDAPDVVLFAVHLAVSREAREVTLQRLLTRRTAQTVDVPLFVTDHQEVTIVNDASASCAGTSLGAVYVTSGAGRA